MIVKNYSSGFLAANINSVVTTITVNPGHNLPTTVGAIFTAIIWNNITYTSPSQDPNAEIVLVQYFSPNTYTITRGAESTAPVAHSAGALIGLYVTAGVLNALPFSTQNIVTLSRGLGTGNIYQNLTGKTMFVNAMIEGGNGGSVVEVFSDSNTTPVTLITEAQAYTGAAIIVVIFMVLPGNYYYISQANSGSASVLNWVEWY